MATLNDLKRQQSGRIVEIRCEGEIAARLMSIGLLPGTEVQVLGVAPFGDPLLVQVNGWQLSLRRNEAAALVLEPIDPEPTEAAV